MSRAIWKGEIVLGDHHVPVKMYSGVEDHGIHFRLLHAKDRAPVEQHIVRKDTGKEVPKEDQRKAYPLNSARAVLLQPEELAELEPPPSRSIELSRFIPRSALTNQWYDRPYYLGPDEDEPGYFALAEALARQEMLGIAHWVMRKSHYQGALTAVNGYLMMITLKRADQIMSIAHIEPPKSSLPTDSELKLAEQLVSTISGDFEPQVWQDEYRNRVLALVQAKARGEKVTLLKPKIKQPTTSLADSLKASLAAARERKVA